MSNNRKQLVVMVKASAAGRVKTRLSAAIGVGRATFAYRHMVSTLLSRVAEPRCWRTLLAVDPDQAAVSPEFATKVPRVGQGRGDLGQRMHALMVELPPGPVVIIGSDCPAIEARHIDQAFKALRYSDVVIGPAPDGGYWLIGMKRFPSIPDIFAEVRWSTPHALADTIANTGGLGVAELETLLDVDTGPDFAASSHLCGRRILPRHVID